MADDELQRKQRADALRRRIERLKRGASPQPPDSDVPPPSPEKESPHQFVQRRMRELAAAPPARKKKPKP